MPRHATSLRRRFVRRLTKRRGIQSRRMNQTQKSVRTKPVKRRVRRSKKGGNLSKAVFRMRTPRRVSKRLHSRGGMMKTPEVDWTAPEAVERFAREQGNPRLRHVAPSKIDSKPDDNNPNSSTGLASRTTTDKTRQKMKKLDDAAETIVLANSPVPHHSTEVLAAAAPQYPSTPAGSLDSNGIMIGGDYNHKEGRFEPVIILRRTDINNYDVLRQNAMDIENMDLNELTSAYELQKGAVSFDEDAIEQAIDLVSKGIGQSKSDKDVPQLKEELLQWGQLYKDNKIRAASPSKIKVGSQVKIWAKSDYTSGSYARGKEQWNVATVQNIRDIEDPSLLGVFSIGQKNYTVRPEQGGKTVVLSLRERESTMREGTAEYVNINRFYHSGELNNDKTPFRLDKDTHRVWCFTFLPTIVLESSPVPHHTPATADNARQVKAEEEARKTERWGFFAWMKDEDKSQGKWFGKSQEKWFGKLRWFECNCPSSGMISYWKSKAEQELMPPEQTIKVKKISYQIHDERNNRVRLEDKDSNKPYDIQLNTRGDLNRLVKFPPWETGGESLSESVVDTSSMRQIYPLTFSKTFESNVHFDQSVIKRTPDNVVIKTTLRQLDKITITANGYVTFHYTDGRLKKFFCPRV